MIRVSKPDPTLPSTLDDAKIGGIGLMLVRKAAGRIEYERTSEQRNRLTVAIPRT